MSASVDELLPVVYTELRQMAARYVRGERPGRDLQPTAIVHEAYLRLCAQDDVQWRDPGHLVAFAARTMRQILVDRAREAGAAKRGFGADPLTLSAALGLGAARAPDLVALGDALEELNRLDPRKGAIVELHFFGGLSFDEIAERLELSRPTVFRDWKSARIWLYRALEKGGPGS